MSYDVNKKNLPQEPNQGKKLKVNRPNYLTPPYRKPTPKEQQRYEQSKQLSILPILQLTPSELLQQQNVEKPKKKAVTKPIPKPTSKSKPTPNKSTQEKRELQKKKKKNEMLKWLNSVQIG